jgi:hypothetical protein
MKTQSLQDLVKKIFGDETTKAQFLKDPESVIARFTLTEQEKKAVLTTHAKLGLVSGNSMQLASAIRPSTDWFAPVP